MRRLCIIAAAIVVAAVGVPGVAQAASAQAVPCSGYSCHGRDPAVWGCDQYQLTSAETDGTLATVVNWYSTGCKANWAQAWLSPAAIAAGDKMVVDIEAIDTQGNEEIMCYPGPSDTGNIMELCYDGDAGYYSGSAPAYTDMVDGTNLTYAAVYVWDSSGNNLLAEYTANQ